MANFKKFLDFVNENLINETRNEEVFDYEEDIVKKTGEIKSVTAKENDGEKTLEQKQMLDRLDEVSRMIPGIEERKEKAERDLKEAKGEMEKIYSDIFDAADITLTRIVETRNVIYQLSKQAKSVSKESIDYKLAFELISKSITKLKNAQELIDAALKEATTPASEVEGVFRAPTHSVKNVMRKTGNYRLEKGGNLTNTKDMENSVIDVEEEVGDTVSEGFVGDTVDKIYAMFPSIKNYIIEVDNHLDELEKMTKTYYSGGLYQD